MDTLQNKTIGTLAIPSGRLVVVDPCYADIAAGSDMAVSTPVKVGDTVDKEYVVIETPNQADVIFTTDTEDGRVAMVTLDFREGLAEPLIREGMEFSHLLPVDVAQLIYADADHLAADWENQDYEDIRIYRNKADGRTLQYTVDFPHYEEPIASEGGATMNALNATGDWERVPYEAPSQRLGYNTVCHGTGDGGRMFGDKAAASRTGWGDGMYPVYVERDKDGAVERISFDFMGLNSEEGEDEDEDDWI